MTSRPGQLLRLKVSDTQEDEGKRYGPLSNKDLEPTPPEERNWSALYFFAFQLSISFSPTTYNIGASLFTIGLNWWTIVIASFVGTTLCCVVLFFNSRGPSWYHVGFPVYVRCAAGIYGSMGFIFIRMIVAIFYMATQTYYSSRLLAVALRAVFGSKWEAIPNHLPASAGITTSNLLAFFLTWLAQLPTAWLHPKNAGPLFLIKSILAPTSLIVTLIWALVNAGGVELDLGTKTLTGGDLGWGFMKSINTVVSGVIPPMVNIADLTRYANRPRDVAPLVAGLFISKPMVILIGLFTTAASAKRFGIANWNLWDYYSLVLDHYWTPGARTLIFLAAFIQSFATIVTNVSSNAIPVGCDLSGLFPKYFTIVRGQILCNLLIWAVVPWLLVNTAANFLTFLGSYICFISPILGCMIIDYWVIRRGNIHIPSLYHSSPSGPYFYTHGFNFRALAAWISGVVLVITGIAGAIKPGSVSPMAVNVYNCGFILSFSAGAVVYYAACKVWPPAIYPEGRDRESIAWEKMAPTEGFFLDDEVVPGYVKERVLAGETREPSTDLDLREKS